MLSTANRIERGVVEVVLELKGDRAMKAMKRRQLHSRPVSERENGVDGRLKEGSSAEITPGPSSPDHREEAKVRRPSGQDVYDDGTKTFFWRAHTVTALVLIAVGLFYVSIIEQTPDDTLYNVRRGVVAVVIVFILIGVIHMPDGPFVRPHPVVWRLVLCILILYVLLLIFALFQTGDDLRQFLAVFDPDLGKPLPERTYADECTIYTPGNPKGDFHNFLDKMDVFVPCHFLGWWAKALIIRDVFVLSVISIGFELMEYTLEPQLPNFGECWWDHWILDFLVCNGLGIWCGMMTCHYLEMKGYHWSGLWKIPTLKGKLKRAVGQFTPYSWTSYQWGYTDSFKRFVFACGLIVLWMTFELNTFYLKAMLWVPPNHSLNLYRALIYGFGGACAVKELYDYLSSTDKNARIGRFSWLTMTAVICECLLQVKIGWDILTIPLHWSAYVVWAIAGLLFSLWVFWHFTFPFKHMPFIGPYFKTLEKKIKGK